MFLSPLYLFGLAAALIPLMLHLRRSRRANPIRFSTTRFFDERFMRAARRAVLQDRLLMLLRMALFCLLALALAQPLATWSWAEAPGAARRVAVVLDDSASMRRQGDQGTLLSGGRHAAVRLLESLSEDRGDTATLVLAGRRDAGAQAIFPELTADLQQVRGQIEAVGATDLGTNLHGAILEAARILQIDEGGGVGSGARSAEIYVFSDLQRGGFAGPGPALGPRVGLFFVALQPEVSSAAAHVSIDAIQLGAAHPTIDVPFAFRVHMTNHDRAVQLKTVRLVVDGKPVSEKTVTLVSGKTVIRFHHRFERPGWARGSVQLVQEDAQARHGTRYFVLRVEKGVSLLAVNGAPSAVAAADELFFLRAALGVSADSGETSGRHRLDVIEPQQIVQTDLAAYRVVLLLNVPELSADAREALRLHVEGGAGLLVTLGDRVRPKMYEPLWSADARVGTLLPARLRGLTGGRPADAGTIAWADTQHPALAAPGQTGAAAYASVSFNARYDLLPDDDAAVLMRASDGAAALVEGRLGAGRVLLFAGTIDRDWTDFPVHPAFLPWLYGLIDYLAGPALDRSGFVRTGQIVSLPTAVGDGPPRVKTPSNNTIRAIAAPLENPAAQPFVLTSIDEAGIYSVVQKTAGRAERPAMLFAANTPHAEWAADELHRDEQLAPFVDERANWHVVRSSADLLSLSNRVRHGAGLWDLLLGAALFVALLEPLLANRMSRSRREGATTP